MASFFMQSIRSPGLSITLDFCVLCQSPESRGFMRVSGQNFYTSKVC